jgi:hypothetical protein
LRYFAELVEPCNRPVHVHCADFLFDQAAATEL